MDLKSVKYVIALHLLVAELAKIFEASKHARGRICWILVFLLCENMRRSLLSYLGTDSMWAWNKFTVFLDSHWRGLEWSHVQWHPVSRWSEVRDVVICLLHCSDFVWKLYPSFIISLFSIQVYPICYIAYTVLNLLKCFCENMKMWLWFIWTVSVLFHLCFLGRLS